MDTMETYLVNLQNKVFKLLPMREAHDSGEDTHLAAYLDNLCANYAGAFACYPDLANVREVVEVRSNVVFLKDNIDVDFKKWRSIVLRSTRLIHTVATRYSEEV